MKNYIVAVALFATCICNLQPCLSSDYEAAVHKKLFAEGLGSPPGVASKIVAALKIDNSGEFKVLGVGSEINNNPVAVKQVYELLNKVRAFPPVPPGDQGKSYVWIVCSWNTVNERTASRAIAGPYFETELPKSVQYDSGILKRSYTDLIQSRFLKKLNIREGAGSARIQLTLGPQGEIKNISISTTDKSQESKIYDGFAKAHPFGPVPTQFASTPRFIINLKWSSNGGTTDAVVEHVNHF